MKRILFDRSIFHGDKFKQIQQSNLMNIVLSGKMQIYYTAGFIEETLRYIRHDKKDFSCQWDYLQKLNNQHWFKNIREIIIAECSKNIGANYYLRSQEDIQNSLCYIQKLITGQIPISVLEPAFEQTQVSRKRMEMLREEIKIHRQEKQYSLDGFDSFVEDNAEIYCRNTLFPAIGINSDIIELLKIVPEEFLFTNYFIRCIFSTYFLPVADHNLRIHTNDKPDAEQLVFLLWTDVLVTDDLQFMTRAFNFLNCDGKKQLWTMDDFLKQLEDQ
jgi:hypothetical protein